MRKWERYKARRDEPGDYAYGCGSALVARSLIGREWVLMVDIDSLPTKRDAQRLAEKLLAVVEAHD